MSPEPDRTTFAHPAERELARILTFHGVRWVYEPTTFVLERRADGAPLLCFNPDFYLPDHNRYLELTTMRQAHVTRKNRKLRLLREHYPSVDAHLLYRRDFERLADRCRVQSGDGAVEVGRTLFAAARIEKRVAEMAGLFGDRDRPDVVVGLGAASRQFAADLVAALRDRGSAPETGEVLLAGADVSSAARRLRVHRRPTVPLERRRVLLVTDIVSTGLTADFAVRWMRAHGAGRIEVATLLDRSAARIVPVPIRAAAFPIGEEIAAGRGLGLRRRLGHLPDIVEVVQTAG